LLDIELLKIRDMNSNKIRFAKSEDIDQIIDLCELHAIYEEAFYAKEGKARQLKEDLFDPDPKLFCLVVENEGKIIAYATYMKQYSTWDAGEYIYMDCIFVRDHARGNKIGENLMTHIKKEAALAECNLIQWHTPDFNTRAIKFYKRIGATSKTKERFFLSL